MDYLNFEEIHCNFTTTVFSPHQNFGSSSATVGTSLPQKTWKQTSQQRFIMLSVVLVVSQHAGRIRSNVLLTAASKDEMVLPEYPKKLNMNHHCLVKR
jgi:hypothetical protein